MVCGRQRGRHAHVPRHARPHRRNDRSPARVYTPQGDPRRAGRPALHDCRRSARRSRSDTRSHRSYHRRRVVLCGRPYGTSSGAGSSRSTDRAVASRAVESKDLPNAHPPQSAPVARRDAGRYCARAPRLVVTRVPGVRSVLVSGVLPFNPFLRIRARAIFFLHDVTQLRRTDLLYANSLHF